jgi:hypothetical protein
MRTREYRRSKELNKYLTRLKFHLPFAVIKKDNEFKFAESVEELSKSRFFKKLKNGDVAFGLINKLDRKLTNKVIRRFLKQKSSKLPDKKYYKKIT